MRRQTTRCPDPHPDGMTLAAATWLASGVVLLGLTPLPLHDADWGWSPAFWLLAAPIILLYARHLCIRQLQIGKASSNRRERWQIARRRLNRQDHRFERRRRPKASHMDVASQHSVHAST